MKTQFELRLYFFVPYNISPIQQAIQAGHAALEFAKYGESEFFREFIKEWKTWVILNGGTTNSALDADGLPFGSLNQIHESLWQNKIDHSLFYEPDLNNALTAVCFICDERVWNYMDYPDWPNFLIKSYVDSNAFDSKDVVRHRMMSSEELKEKFPESYRDWVRLVMGNEKNVFLRELIKGKKLA